MSRSANKQKVIVVGAGPVGALAALYAANRGDDVHVYELRAGELMMGRISYVFVAVILTHYGIFYGCLSCMKSMIS